MATTAAEAAAEFEANQRKEARAGRIACAVDLVAKAAEGLAGIKGGDPLDEVRILVMGQLRAAIDHIHEAG